MDRSPPTDETVRLLADLLGVRLEPARMPAIAAHLAELLVVVSALDGLDLDGVAPDTIFDPRWAEATP